MTDNPFPRINRFTTGETADSSGRFQTDFTKDLRIVWDWDDLLQDAAAAGENRNLAVAGLILSRQAEFAAVKAETFLRQIGCENIRSEYYLISTSTKNDISNPARTFGYKKIEKDGKTWFVICAVFKGTTTISDTITDIMSVKDGFLKAGENSAASLRRYVYDIKGAARDNTVLFITGHSLGASTANMVGRLSSDLACERATFVYAFASPNYEAGGETDPRPNFHDFVNRKDVVPVVPPALPPRYFSKVGVEHAFDLETLGDEQRARFEQAYRYFRGTTFEKDTDLAGLGIRENESLGFKALKNHLAHTYMSFILSEMTDEEMNLYFV